jgi:hypothetical protein
MNKDVFIKNEVFTGIIKHNKTVSTEEYFEIIKYCEEEISLFYKLQFSHYFTETFILDEFREVIKPFIESKYINMFDYEVELYKNNSFNTLIFALHRAYIRWLKEQYSEYLFIDKYFKNIDKLDTDFQGLKIQSALAETDLSKSLDEQRKWLADYRNAFQGLSDRSK